MCAYATHRLFLKSQTKGSVDELNKEALFFSIEKGKHTASSHKQAKAALKRTPDELRLVVSALDVLTISCMRGVCVCARTGNQLTYTQ